MDRPRYEYLVDQDDVITEVNGEWRAFARGNTASDLPDRVRGSWLWQHIQGTEVKHLYRALLDRVRDEGVRARVPFRCDAPDLRRFMILEIAPLPDRGIRFTSWAEKEEPRAPVPVLHPSPQDDPSEILTMCAWCKRVVTPEGEWLEVEEALNRLRLFDAPRGPAVSHGVCSDCRSGVMEELVGAGTGTTLKTRRGWGR